MQWLKHFQVNARPTKENPVLLILDGHSSHTKNLEAIHFARENGIVVLSLPPHTTHRLQPLDRTFFKPLMGNFNTTCDQWMRNHACRQITIYQISALFREAYVKSATMSNGVSVFNKTGIWPCNRSIFTDSDFVAADHFNTTITATSPDATCDPLTTIKATSSDATCDPLTTIKATSPDATCDPLTTIKATSPDATCDPLTTIKLQFCDRNQHGLPTDHLLKVYEVTQADSLHAAMIKELCLHFKDYEHLDHRSNNVDLPITVRYDSIQERIASMATPTEMIGEIEIIALTRALKQPLNILMPGGSVITYGEQFSSEQPLTVILKSRRTCWPL